VITFPDTHLSFIVDPARLQQKNGGPVCIGKPTIRLTEKAYLFLELNSTAQSQWTNRFGTTTEHMESSTDNAALQFIVEQIMTQLQAEVDALRYATCVNREWIVDLLMHMMPHDPTSAMRIALRRDDVVAGLAGRAVMTAKCHQRVVDHEYDDFKVGDTCYEYMPVSIDGRVMYVRPMSRDLVDTSPKVDCHHRLPVYTMKNGQWHTQTSAVQVTTVPTHLLFASRWRPFLMAPPAAFHADLAGATSLVQLQGEQMSRMAELEQSMEKVRSQVTEASGSDIGDTIAEGVEETELLVENVVANAVSSASSMASKALTAVEDELEKPFQFIRMVIVLVLTVIIVGALITAVIKYKAIQWCQRQFRREHRHANLQALASATAERMNATADALSPTIRATMARLNRSQEAQAIEMTVMNSENVLNETSVDDDNGERASAHDVNRESSTNGQLMMMQASKSISHAINPASRRAMYDKDGELRPFIYLMVKTRCCREATFVLDTGSTYNLLREETVEALENVTDPVLVRRVPGSFSYTFGTVTREVKLAEMEIQFGGSTRVLTFGIAPKGDIPIEAWGVMGAGFTEEMQVDLRISDDSQVADLCLCRNKAMTDAERWGREHARRPTRRSVKMGNGDGHEEMANGDGHEEMANGDGREEIDNGDGCEESDNGDSRAVSDNGDGREEMANGDGLEEMANNDAFEETDEPVAHKRGHFMMMKAVANKASVNLTSDNKSVINGGHVQIEVSTAIQCVKDDACAISTVEALGAMATNDGGNLNAEQAAQLLHHLDNQAKSIYKVDAKAKLLDEVAMAMGNTKYNGRQVVTEPQVSAERLMCEAELGGVHLTRCLLDTGASLSLCQQSVFDRIKASGGQYTITEDNVKVNTLTGANLKINDFIRSTIVLGRGAFKYDVIVGVIDDSSMSHQMVLGMNLFAQMKSAYVDFPDAPSVLSRGDMKVQNSLN
jgi:hypothetical protein